MPARLAIFYPFYANFYRYYHDIVQLPHMFRALMFIVPPLLLILNTFWFFKISRGIVRVVVRGMAPTEASREEQRLFRKQTEGSQAAPAD